MRKKVCLLLPLMIFACAGKGGSAHQASMKGEPISSSRALKIAIFNTGTNLDRTALIHCDEEFPGVEVFDEIDVHRTLRDSNLTAEQFLALGDRFISYEPFSRFQLLLIAFRSAGKDYLRTVNFLGRYVTTVVLDLPRPTCTQILAAQRLVLVESVPALADVQLDQRTVGETPLWLWLKDGTHEIQCKLPGDSFKPISVQVPREVRAICQHENVMARSGGDGKDDMSGEEKAGSVLVFLVSIIGAAAAVIIPFLFLL